jgi:hypothetical protein
MVDSSRRSFLLLGLVVAVCLFSGIPGDAMAEFQRAVRRGSGSCPAGWTVDPLRAACGRCPAGYSRSVLPLDAMACERPATVLPARATRRALATGPLGTECPAGQFPHLLAIPVRCYSCPSGYTRTASGIDAGDACARPVVASYSPAQWRPACPAGSFRDLLRGDCWSCPANWTRTAAPVDSATACTSDVTGILGVDTRAMCVDALATIRQGGQMAGEAQSAVASLMSPLMQPINDGIDTIVGQFRTPVQFERLLERLRARFAAYRPFFDEFPDWTTRIMNARSRLLRLMLDPAVACDGDFARVNREFAAMDLWPRSARTAPAPDGLVFNVLRRPVRLGESEPGLRQTPRGYLVISIEANIPIPMPAAVASRIAPKVVGSFSVLYDPLPLALLGSLGGGVGRPQPLTGGIGVNVIYFPYALPDDFLKVGSLGTQLNFQAGVPAETVFEVLGGVKMSVPFDIALSLDVGDVVSAIAGKPLTTVPAGLGVSLTYEFSRQPSGGTDWETASSDSMRSIKSNISYDMTSLASTTSAGSKPRSERIGELFKAFLKQFSLSVDWTGRILQR